MTIAGAIGGLVFLVLGFVELAVMNRSLFPVLRWRHEKAKTTQQQGISPSAIMTLVKIQSLILMPLLGLLVGERVKSIFG